MTIRKSMSALLAALLLTGTVCAAALPEQQYSAQAQTQAAVLTTENASLFLPESYEQYLALETPSDVALSEHYLAVADKNKLYLYERKSGTYLTYETQSTADTVTRLQFSGDKLYFSVRGTANSFWYYDCAEEKASQVASLNCSTFLIVDDTLYTAIISGNQTTLARRSLNDLESSGVPLGTLSTGTEPWLTWANDTLYCVVDGIVYYPDGADDGGMGGFDIADYNKRVGISSVCSDGEFLYFSSDSGFYRRETTENAQPVLLSAQETMCGVTSLTWWNGKAYCIRGASVLEIGVTDTAAAFTGYEIAAASSSQNRLSGASDSARAGDLLVTADTGNSRVSVYSISAGTYTTLACEAAPSLVATDGELIACAAGAQVYTCDFGGGERTFTSAQLSGVEIAGLAVLYGETYYVKNNGTRGVVGGAAVEMGSATPTGLTCDLYGTLYVSYQDGSASAFTEEQFTAGGTGEDTGISVAPGATSLKADFEGNLYYLVGGDLYRNGELFAQADGSAFTYSASEKPRSFALGFEDDAVYFNFGNYIVVSDASTEQAPGPLAGIPTLGEIAESGARETAFSLHEEELLVTVAARSVGIRTDITAFRGGESAYFPYCGYERSAKARAGLLLARTPEDAGGYSLVLFPEEDGSYTAYLYKTSSVTTEEEALREESGTRWISNDVDACFAPCLESALSADVLPRGQAVTVKGYFTAPDREYALVEYEQSADGAARATVRGWVPASYLSEVSPSLAAGEQYTFAYLKSNEEGVTFTAADGSEQTVTERVQVQLFDNGDGTYTARLAGDPAYSAVVTEEMLDRDNAEVLRISLIIILTVLALVILGVYIFLLPWEKYKKRRK